MLPSAGGTLSAQDAPDNQLDGFCVALVSLLHHQCVNVTEALRAFEDGRKSTLQVYTSYHCGSDTQNQNQDDVFVLEGSWFRKSRLTDLYF